MAEAAPPDEARAPAWRGWRVQLVVVLSGLALWAIHPLPSFASLLLAYVAAWLVLSVLAARDPRFWRIGLKKKHAVVLGILLALAPLARAADLVGRMTEEEGLAAIDHVTAARLRLEETPSIAPPLVAADRPQTFYVNAPGGARVAVRFGDSGPRVDARALGHGLFRLVYDPRRSGPPSPPDGPLEITLEVDGTAHRRSMEAAEPLAHPRWLTPSPDRRAVAAVSEETDELFVASEEGLITRATVDDGPTDVRFVSAERLAITHRYSDSLLFVGLDGAIERRVRIGPFAEHVALSIDGSLLAVTRAGSRPELVLVTSAGRVRERVELEERPEWIAFGPDADTLVVSTRRPAALHRFSRTGSRWREDRPPLLLGRPAVTLAASPEGSRIVVAVTDYRPDGARHLGNHFVQDQLVDVDVASWRVVERRLTAERTSRQESPGNVDRGVSPVGIDVLDDGSRWVAFAGTDDVWRLGDGLAVPETIALDAHPVAAPCSAVGLRGGHVAVSSPAYGTIAFFSRTGRRTQLVRLAPDDHTLLRERERALQRRIGERSFYESTRAGISCQSCHLHGGSDGAEHNIGGATFVSTLDSRGLLGTPPFLRDGGYPTLGSLDEVAQTLYRGYVRRQGGRRFSLDRYLASLPRPIRERQLERADAARERRGLDVFVEARCPVCHAFPAFTNLGQHPADAFFPEHAAHHPGTQLDTPSLLGLATSAPYLVDGRAKTLEEVFRRHDRAHRHGDTAELEDGELGDLIYFLEGL